MAFEPEVAKPKCHHIWIPVSTEVGTGIDVGKRRYVHRCPKCGYVKTTIRRVFPPQKRSEAP